MPNKATVKGMKIDYNVIQRKIKYPRLELRTGSLILVVPTGFKNPEKLIDEHESWIYEKISVIKESQDRSKGKTLNLERTEDELRAFLISMIDVYTRELSVKPNRVTLRKMKSKWGSCSPKKNMNFNKILKYLPEDLIQYVVFHEMTHLKEKKHGKEFWDIISINFKNYQEKENELMDYWFLIQENCIREVLM